MDVRIGVIYTSKELDIDLPDDADTEEVQADIETALTSEGSILWITDRKGRKYGVPVDKVAYIEVGSPEDSRRIGFGS